VRVEVSIAFWVGGGSILTQVGGVMRFRCQWAGFLGLTVFVTFLPRILAQENAHSLGLFISGMVRDDETHQAISAVTLELQRDSGEIASAAIVSGTRGEYQFNGIISGDYHILAHAEGYAPASVSVMLGGVPLYNILVSLHHINANHAPPPTDPVSLHQLNIPDKARDAFDKGMKLMIGSKPDYRRALTNFEKAIKEYADYYEAFAEMGVAYDHLGDKVAAETALRKAVEMSSQRYLDALFLLAEMLNDSGRYVDAQIFARQCATQDESSWMCALELARSLAGLKHPVEAEAIANKASQLNPNNAKTFLVLGNIHIQEKKYEAVVQDFDTYLKLEPAGPQSEQVRASEAQARRALANASATNPSRP